MGADVLSAVCRVENASISWLLEGRGSPYLVHHAATDGEAAALVEQLVEDEPGWSVYQIHGPNGRLAVALTQPAQFERKGDWIDYTVLEVVVGEVGEKTLAFLNHVSTNSDQHQVELDEDLWRRLQAGQLGTWHLVGDSKNPGVLAGGRPAFMAQDEGVEYPPPLSTDAKRLGRWFDSITECRRTALLGFLELTENDD